MCLQQGVLPAPLGCGFSNLLYSYSQTGATRGDLLGPVPLQQPQVTTHSTLEQPGEMQTGNKALDSSRLARTLVDKGEHPFEALYRYACSHL